MPGKRSPDKARLQVWLPRSLLEEWRAAHPGGDGAAHLARMIEAELMREGARKRPRAE